jgi:hypothetical protein
VHPATVVRGAPLTNSAGAVCTSWTEEQLTFELVVGRTTEAKVLDRRFPAHRIGNQVMELDEAPFLATMA